jgi:adenylate cyclase
VHYSGRAARRLRQTNAFNGIVVVLYAVFASFYAALDWQALQPLA